jgi:hypothetical protein
MLNLTHRDGHERVVEVVPGDEMEVTLALDFAGHSFSAGHSIRLSLSSVYWPFAWPSPEPVTLELTMGRGSRLELPERGERELDRGLGDFGRPETTPAPAGTVAEEATRTSRHELSGGQLETWTVVEERSRLDETDLDFGERQESRHSIVEGQPLSARAEYAGEHYLRRGDWDVRVVVRTALTADAEEFTVATDLDAYLGQVQVHTTRRAVRIPRDGV